jgi:hypothetical protein
VRWAKRIKVYQGEKYSHKCVPGEKGDYTKVCPKFKSLHRDKPRTIEKKHYRFKAKKKL